MPVGYLVGSSVVCLIPGTRFSWVFGGKIVQRLFTAGRQAAAVLRAHAMRTTLGKRNDGTSHPDDS